MPSSFPNLILWLSASLLVLLRRFCITLSKLRLRGGFDRSHALAWLATIDLAHLFVSNTIERQLKELPTNLATIVNSRAVGHALHFVY